MKSLFLAALAALSLGAAVVPAAHAVTFGFPRSSLVQHQGPYDNTGHGPGETGLQCGGG